MKLPTDALSGMHLIVRYAILLCMTTHQITEVLERVRTWPQKRQQEAVQVLLEMEQQDSTLFRLTPEQVEDVKIGLAEADRGVFATEAGMGRTWRKFGL